MSEQEQIEKAAILINEANFPVALTGAGISTESGLPDYRGTKGLWRNKTFEQLASLSAWRSNPKEFWEFYRERLDVLSDADPNPGHHALYSLELIGKLNGVVTQNVDGLHKKAGSETLEVHGTLATCVCLSCKFSTPSKEVGKLEDSDRIPRCPNCQAVLKPNVILFEEMLPDDFGKAEAMIFNTDLLIVVGSSLAVYPVANIPAMVHNLGGRVLIINQGATDYDHSADLKIDGRAGDILPKIAELVHGMQADSKIGF